MCEYCEIDCKNNNEYQYMNNMPVLDDFDKKLLTGINRQYQYIRKSKKTYNLITELNNDEGDVLNLPINYCPMCGRKLRERK